AVARPGGTWILVTERERVRGRARHTERDAVGEIALPDRNCGRRQVGEPAVVTQEPSHAQPASARGTPGGCVAHAPQTLERREREELGEGGDVEPVPPSLPVAVARVRDAFAEMGDAKREREQAENQRDPTGKDRPVGAIPAVASETAVARVALDRLGEALPPLRRLRRRTDLECFDRSRSAGRPLPDEIENLALV